MSGCFSFKLCQFNRSTQSKRQPGSAFKPFVYVTALNEGFNPSTLILDAPYVIDQGPGLPKWKPANYTDEFYGLTTIRTRIEKSRNLMTIRLANEVGIIKILDTAKKDSEKLILEMNNKFHKSAEIKKKLAETKIIQMKENALKDIKNVSIKISMEATEHLIKNSIDKNKLDKIYSESLEQTKTSLKNLKV